MFHSAVALFAVLPLILAAPNVLVRSPPAPECPAPPPPIVSTVTSVSTCYETKTLPAVTVPTTVTSTQTVPTTIVTTNTVPTTVVSTQVNTVTAVVSSTCSIVCGQPTTILPAPAPSPAPSLPPKDGALPDKRALFA